MAATQEYCLKCAEVWGGIDSIDTCARTGGISTCLYSRASDGGKGGDIYFFSSCKGDKLSRVTIADVVGHGEKVSEISQWLYDAMFDNLNSLDSAAMLRGLNNTVYHKGLDALTTAAVFTYYKSDNNLNFSYAGHHPLLVKRHNETEWNELVLPTREDKANVPLGILEDVDYDQQCQPLQSGDRIFAYTDGVIEARNPGGKFYGKEGIIDVLNRSNGSLTDIKSNVVESLTDFTQSDLDHDDVTYMVIEIN
jgi:sigma-B regulation protein RsbU (phosphoserine phosphatase)